MKPFLAYFIAFSALVVSLISAWNDHDGTDHQHQAFFRDVRNFMSRGGRNTAEQGKALCERISVLEMEAGREPVDCATAYVE